MYEALVAGILHMMLSVLYSILRMVPTVSGGKALSLSPSGASLTLTSAQIFLYVW